MKTENQNSNLITHDYSIFMYMKGNIDIDNLKRIEGFMKDNFLPTSIKVKPKNDLGKHEIIDGQYRFEASRNLGLPIYYDITDEG